LIRFKLDLSELVRLTAAVQQTYLISHRGKIFSVLKADGELMMFYTETEPKDSFIRYNILEDKMKWVSRVEKTTDVVYICVIKADEVEGLEFK